MAICVVAIHTHPLESCTISILNDFYECFVRMAVPFFFLSSGFLLAQKFDSSFASHKNVVVIREYLLKFVKMYVLWTIIYLPMAIYHYISSDKGILKSVLLYVKGFIFIGEQYNSWHLWYLLSTIYALVFVLILQYLKLSHKKVIIVSTVVFLISIGIDFLVAYNGNSNIFVELLIKMIKVSIASGRIFTGMFYIPLGIVLSRRQPNLAVSWSMLIGGYLLNILVKINFLNSVFLAISAIGLFCVINSFVLPDSKIYPFVRKMSTVIYFIHMYVWSFYYMLIYGEKTYGLDCFLITIAICLILSAVSVAIMNMYNKNKLKNLL